MNKVTYEELKCYLINNISTLKDLLNEINSWNGYLYDLDYQLNDEDFFNTYFYNNPNEAVRSSYYGDYNYMDDYVKFNAYGNLESCTELEFEEQLKDYVEEILDTFLEYYADNNVDTYDIEFKNMISDYYNEESEEK